MKLIKTIICLTIIGYLAGSDLQSLSAKANPFKRIGNTSNIHPVTDSSKMAWWNKARFGMFIHWGVYSVPAGVYNGKETPGLGEWIMHDDKIPVDTYQAYAKSFNPVDYDPEKWVLMAKNAGMKYIVITTKHHDGFAMFDSKASDWNVVKATPYGKDVIRMLADACRKYGMKLGFYYSQANDWNNPGGAAYGGHWDKKQDGNMDDYIDNVAVPQVREILNNYGDVAELWWDVPSDMTKERAAKFLPLLKDHPNLITNDRLGGGITGDIGTPEQEIPDKGIPGLNWETCMTINDTWGYKKDDHNWKSSKELIRNLIEIASKGGNYLLNVGPEATGQIPEPIIKRLANIGDWMKVNSEAIYGTSASPFKSLTWGRCTLKTLDDGNTALYLSVFDWPVNQKINLPGLRNTVLSAKLLADGQVLKTQKLGDDRIVVLPVSPLDTNATVIKLIIKGKPDIINKPIYIHPDEQGKLTLTPSAADIHVTPTGKYIQVEGSPEKNLGYWTDTTSFVSWPIKVNKPGKYLIQANILCPFANTLVSIITNNHSITASLSKTDWSNYQVMELGKIVIEKTGPNTLYIKPVAQNWKFINLRNVTLTPVQ